MVEAILPRWAASCPGRVAPPSLGPRRQPVVRDRCPRESGERMIHSANGGRKRPSAIRVMHVIDTQEGGGAERVAVNLANLLPRCRYETHFCTTRSEGVLAGLIADDVG